MGRRGSRCNVGDRSRFIRGGSSTAAGSMENITNHDLRATETFAKSLKSLLRIILKVLYFPIV